MFISTEKIFHPPLLPWFRRGTIFAGILKRKAQAQWLRLPNAWRVGLAATGYILLLSSVDALCGGGFSLSLKEDGYWHPAYDQTANDFYQAGFGFLCAVFLLWRAQRNFPAALAAMILLVGYVEDRLYYLLLPLCSPIFEWRNLPRVGLNFPDEVSGWIGWTARMFSNHKISFDDPQWYLLNISALCLAAIVVLQAARGGEEEKNSCALR